MVKISFRLNPDYKYMYDDCVYQMKEQNKSLNPFIGNKLNSTNTEKLGQYESYWLSFFLYWPSFSILAEFVIGMMRADFAIQILY